METKRLILAIVVSFALLFLWQLVLVKKPAVPETPAGGTAAPATVAPATVPPAPETKPAAAEKAPLAAPGAAVGAAGEERISIATPLYSAVFSNRGGVLESFRLRQHLDDKGQELELVPAAAKAAGLYPLALLDERVDPYQADLAAFRSDVYNAPLYKTTGGSAVLEGDRTATLAFEYSDGKDLSVRKTFVFHGGGYDFGIEVEIVRNGQRVEPRLVWGPGIGNPAATDTKKQIVSAGGGMTALSGRSLVRVDERKYKPEGSAVNFASWIGYDDNYFAALFIPAAGAGSAQFLMKPQEQASRFYLSAWNPARIFIGPKEFDTLSAFGHETKKIVRWGTFGIVSEVLFRGIQLFRKAIPNYGWGIVLMTLVIKIIFFPLTYSSTKSMAKMAELQPKIKALRAKYKKSKTDIEQRRAMNEEMMKLYKSHGVNPAGGCLPILIQLPVFFGFFRLLSVSIEFRHSPWILWIKDLSVKDPIYITPLLMGATQFISQKMTPTSADPSQARMMLIMPVIFTVFFMNFQSGLVLYWLTSNVLQIGQQALMNKMMRKRKGADHGQRRKT